jgi:lysophospholipase L1-like esterase
MGKTLPEIMAAFSKLIEQLRQSKPTMKIIVSILRWNRQLYCTDYLHLNQVAKIIPLRMNPTKVTDLNKQIAAQIPPKTTATSPITLVDCWTGFDSGPDLKDGVHPSDSGDKKMVKCFHAALVEAIKSST